jgi:hypothetical protein
LATALLLQFTAETSSMHSWINEKNVQLSELRADSGDPHNIVECKRRAQVQTTISMTYIYHDSQMIGDEVTANGTRLTSIRSLALRIQDELTGYLQEIAALNQSHDNMIKLDGGEITITLNRLQNEYTQLIERCQQLTFMHTKITELSTRYKEQLNDVDKMIDQVK